MLLANRHRRDDAGQLSNTSRFRRCHGKNTVRRLGTIDDVANRQYFWRIKIILYSGTNHFNGWWPDYCLKGEKNSVQENTINILHELENNALKIDDSQAAQFISQIRNARHIFLQGSWA